MLKGRRLFLRAVARDDLPRYVEWINDPEVTQHLLIYLPMSLDDETDWYEQQRQDPTTQNFAIVLNDEERHIGSIGLMQINRKDQNAELGIMIGNKTMWGQGYGQEAIEQLLTFAFNQMNLHRIYLRVDAGHAGAIRCYEQCGFIEEGRLREAIFHNGYFEDQIVMGVLRSEYANHSPCP